MSTQQPNTRQAITEAGFRLLSRNPGANLEQIARSAGVTRATLHRYYPSRTKLIAALALTAIEEMDEAVARASAGATTTAQSLRDSLFALIPLGDRHGFLAHEDIQAEPEVEVAFERMRAEMLDWMEAAKAEGLFDASLPASWCVRSFDYLLYAAWESVRSEELTATQAAQMAWRTLTQGLGGTP